MSELGQLSLALAFVASAIGFCTCVWGIIRRSESRIPYAMQQVIIAASSTAVFALLVALLQHDFRLKYVAEHTDKALSTLYVIAALWGGQSGSLLLWAFLLAIFSGLAIRQLKRQEPELALPAATILLFIEWFFILLLVFVEDPFERFGLTPVDGRGLNPLLRTVEMLFHPPTLYLGYVGTTIPFAIFAAALWKRNLSEVAMRLVRLWTLFAWGMLTVGIVLGAEWAYIELGWGGYWAWDPVENASLMPWLIGVATLHACLLAQRRRVLITGSFILVVANFLLCLFGTFLTRSGIVASVHAFGRSPLLYFFLAIMIVVAVFSIVTFARRRATLSAGKRIAPLMSRDGFTAGGILVLIGTTAAVLWGTVLPVLSELLVGRKMVWDVPRFDVVVAPFAVLLLAALAFTFIVRLGAGNNALATLKRLALPIVAGLAGGYVGIVSGSMPEGAMPGDYLLYKVLPPILLAFAGFLAAAILQDVIAEVIARGKLPSRPRLGAAVAHLGLAIAIAGVTGSAFVVSREVTLKQNESTTIGSYTATYNGMKYDTPADASQVSAAQLVYTGPGGKTGKLEPSLIFYRQSDSPHPEVSIKSGLMHDFYAILSGYDANAASFKLLVYPMTTWLWIGGAMTVLGAGLAAYPRRKSVARAVQSVVQPVSSQSVNYCARCGRKIGLKDAAFCPGCGASLKEQLDEA